MNSINVKPVGSENDFKVGDILCVDSRKSAYFRNFECYEIMSVNTQYRQCNIRPLHPTKDPGESFEYEWDSIRSHLKYVLRSEDRAYKLGVSLLCISLHLGLKEELQKLLVEVGL